MSPKRNHWLAYRRLTPEILALARAALEDVRAGLSVSEAVRRHPWDGGHLSKSALVAAYNQLVETGQWQQDAGLLARIRLKPVRTLSGVTTVTVLTKPYPCPGKCIFCPEEAHMPKSYLSDEPGAMRAVENKFDPYRQVHSRLEALASVGHPTDKVELLILGGTWSTYKRDYQEWFVQRCFEAMNGDIYRTMADAHALNEVAPHRNVGLVIETRPETIKPRELARLRRLGVTKVQIGAQSLDDRLLELNRRGHTVAELHQAVALLRGAGFKIVLHWMPNLLGATPESDRQDFARLWEDVCPDELKIYPTQLLRNTELYECWQRGEFTPYTTEQLIQLIADVKPTIPPYCRVNRVVRDIPSVNVVEGNRRTSLRQDVLAEIKRRGALCQCIRCREVSGQKVDRESLRLDDLVYPAGGGEERFLSFVTPADKLAGFLRLTLPGEESPPTGLADLQGAAIIREVHIYGQSLEVGKIQPGAAQHAGLGGRLIGEAERLSRERGYQRLAVISAVGTRLYYLKRGFERRELYLVKNLTTRGD